MTVVRADALPDQLSRRGALNQVLVEYGPFDEPTYCYRLGLGFAAGEMFRQAVQQLERVKALVPGDLSVRLLLGDWYGRSGNAGRALQIAAEIRADPYLQPLDPTNAVEVAFLEARACLSVTNRLTAQGIIDALLFAHPGDSLVAVRAASTFAAYGDYPDAFRIIDRLLELAPNDPAALAEKGSLCVLRGDFSNAIPPLTISLSLTNNYAARLTRAFAYMQSGRLDEAEADYNALLNTFPNIYQTYNWLGELALRRKDTNTAIRHFEQFLAKGGPDSREARVVAARLKTLQPSRH